MFSVLFIHWLGGWTYASQYGPIFLHFYDCSPFDYVPSHLCSANKAIHKHNVTPSKHHLQGQPIFNFPLQCLLNTKKTHTIVNSVHRITHGYILNKNIELRTCLGLHKWAQFKTLWYWINCIIRRLNCRWSMKDICISIYIINLCGLVWFSYVAL